MSAAFAAALAPGMARAAAWTAPSPGLLLATGVTGLRDDELFNETDLYAEKPLSRRLSAVIAAQVEEASIAGRRQWREEATVAAKAVVRQGPRFVTAVQVGAFWRSDPLDGCGEGGGEARILQGWSKPAGAEGSIFLNGEAAVRVQAGGCPQARLDFTAGWRANRRWMALAQAFAQQDVGGGAREDSVLKLQLSVVRLLHKGGGVQVGVRVRADRNGGDDKAILLGWWAGVR